MNFYFVCFCLPLALLLMTWLTICQSNENSPQKLIKWQKLHYQLAFCWLFLLMLFLFGWFVSVNLGLYTFPESASPDDEKYLPFLIVETGLVMVFQVRMMIKRYKLF